MTKKRTDAPTATDMLDVAKALADSGNLRADVRALADAFWEEWGGAAGIAKEVKTQYDANEKDGSPAKMNLLSRAIAVIERACEADAKTRQDSQEDEIDPEKLAPFVASYLKDHGLSVQADQHSRTDGTVAEIGASDDPQVDAGRPAEGLDGSAEAEALLKGYPGLR